MEIDPSKIKEYEKDVHRDNIFQKNLMIKLVS